MSRPASAVDRLCRLVERVLDSNDKYVTLIADMKREGFVAPAREAANAETAVLPDDVMQAIADRSVGPTDPRFQYLKRYAEGRIRAGVEVPAVVGEILEGGDVDSLLSALEDGPPQRPDDAGAEEMEEDVAEEDEELEPA